MEGHEIPDSKKRKFSAGVVTTYDELIPRYCPSELGLTTMPGYEAPAPYETPFFGMATVRKLAFHFFNDEITDYDQLTLEVKIHFAKSIRCREREVTLFSNIQHHPHIMKLVAFLSFEEKDKNNTNNINGIVFEYAPQGTVTDCRIRTSSTVLPRSSANFGKYSFSADVWSFGIFHYFVTHNNPPYCPTASPVGIRLTKCNGGLDHLSESQRDQMTIPFFFDLIGRLRIEPESRDQYSTLFR